MKSLSKHIVLIGHPNSGKTSIFNQLTQRREYVGNWDGVTVDMNKGELSGLNTSTLIDLPGIYSLSGITAEEKISTEYLKQKDIDLIINVLDMTKLRKELYLTMELISLGKPLILLLNKADLQGDEKSLESLITELAEHLGLPYVIHSSKKNNHNKLNSFILNYITTETATLKQIAHQTQSTLRKIYTGPILNTLDDIVHLLPENEENAFTHALKLLEHESERQTLNHETQKNVLKLIDQLEKNLDLDIETALVEARHHYIEKLLPYTVKTKRSISDKIDHFVLNRYLAFPIFIGILWFIYYLAISSIGGSLIDFINDDVFDGILKPFMVTVMTALSLEEWLQNLVLDSFISGLGTLLSFTPQLFILFTLLTILEDSGYMGRVALILDKLLKPFGLSGRSVIPFIVSSGCSVPGIMASRTIKSTGEQKRTIILAPFIPCGAKLPIIALISAMFFADASWIIPSIYGICLTMIIFSSIILKKIHLYPEEDLSFITTLPQYECPRPKEVLRMAYLKTKAFVVKAGTLILLGCGIISTLNQFNFRFEVVDAQQSMLSHIGENIATLFAPLGFDNTAAAIATFTGFIAKENIVATLGILVTGSENADAGTMEAYAQLFPPLAAYSFLVFNMLCAPCFAALGAMKKELGNWKNMLIALIFQTTLAYIVALILFQLGRILEGDTYTTIILFLIGMWILIIASLFIKGRKQPIINTHQRKKTIKEHSIINNR